MIIVQLEQFVKQYTRQKNKKMIKYFYMTERERDLGFEKIDTEQMELNGYCGELLGSVIPKLLQRSDEEQKQILHRGLADIDITFLAYDYHIDGLTSYRIRLVPRMPYESKPSFKDFGIVRQVIINVPVDFVQDTSNLNDIGLAIVSFYLDESQTTLVQRYVIAPDAVRPFSNFADLDFSFNRNLGTSASHVTDISVGGSGAAQKDFVAPSDVHSQLINTKEIYSVINSLQIGNQSLNDGTANE